MEYPDIIDLSPSIEKKLKEIENEIKCSGPITVGSYGQKWNDEYDKRKQLKPYVHRIKIEV